MSKNKSIQKKLEGRTPATMRQLITPVDMLERKQQAETTNGRKSVTQFDVFQDQLDDLREIALRQQKATRKRVLLGDGVCVVMEQKTATIPLKISIVLP